MMDKKSSQGFSLVEAIFFVVFIGGFAAFALPRVVDLSDAANKAATNAIAGALSSANISNYMMRKQNAASGIAIANCTDVSNVMQGGLPTGFAIKTTTVTADKTVSCTVTGPGDITASFNATGVA